MLVQAALVTQEQHLLALAGEVERILEQQTCFATATNTNERAIMWVRKYVFAGIAWQLGSNFKERTVAAAC